MDAVPPLDQMTAEEKLRAMEAIWRSLSKTRIKCRCLIGISKFSG
jgi:hypothetical protein